ncbi:hypothetical protein GEMRC1_008435 [Eukaryota sp. GEM-RC1]
MTPSGLLMSHTVRGSNPPRLDVSYPVETESSVLSVMCSGGSDPPHTVRGSNPPRVFSAETEGFIPSEVDLGGDYGPNPGLTTQGSCREEAYSLISATPDELIPQWSVSCGNTRQKQSTFENSLNVNQYAKSNSLSDRKRLASELQFAECPFSKTSDYMSSSDSDEEHSRSEIPKTYFQNEYRGGNTLDKVRSRGINIDEKIKATPLVDLSLRVNSTAKMPTLLVVDIETLNDIDEGSFVVPIVMIGFSFCYFKNEKIFNVDNYLFCVGDISALESETANIFSFNSESLLISNFLNFFNSISPDFVSRILF